MEPLTWSILIFVSWLASTISGIAGFGGSLLILPVFSHLVGAKQAIPILTIAWMMGNGSRAALGFKDIRWTPVLYFCLGAIPGALIGAKIFLDLPAAIVMKMIGVFLLVMLALQLWKKMPAIPVKWFLPVGFLVGFLSSLFGSAGPIGAAAFLSLNLPPAAYVASEAVTSLVIHGSKTLFWQHYRLITPPDALVGMVLGLAMIAGSATGKLFIKHLRPEHFRMVVYGMMFIAAISLLI